MSPIASTEEEVKSVWRNADCVCFDVDSTVCTDEGIDELASFLNVGREVANLTNQAMGGSMTFKESFRKRLDIIQPSTQDIQRFLEQHKPQLTPGLKELVSLLHERSIPVYLISGGISSIIEPVAQVLGIPKAHIYANKLTFYYDGELAGFDEDQPTCQAGGKPRVIKELKNKHGYERVVHIGDGTTDMEASPPADAFIGFGGNVIRPKVKEGSKWFALTFQDLIDELNNKNEN